MPGDSSKPSWLSRLVPTRLSARLTAGFVLAFAVVFTLTATVMGTILTIRSQNLAHEQAAETMAAVSTGVSLDARQLESVLAGLAGHDAVLGAAPVSSETPPDEKASELARLTGATAVAWVSGDRNVHSFGDTLDSSALAALAAGHPDGIRGTIALPTGPAVVAVRPIEIAGRREVLAVARKLTTGDLKGVAPGSATLEEPARMPSAGKGWVALSDRGGASGVTRFEDNAFLTWASFTGVDGKPAFAVRFWQPDAWFGPARRWAIPYMPIALGLLVTGIGYALGSAVSRSISRPLHSFIDYLQDQGFLALQGLRTDEALLVDPDLPEDFARLGRVISDLLAQLRVNQAELIEAGDQALSAERAFRTVVEESPEVKILVQNGVVEIANPAAAHFLGLQLGSLLRAEPEGLFTGVEFFAEDGSPIDLVDVAGQAYDQPMVARVVAHGQPDRWVELSVAFIDPLRNDYVISARNITEERRLEALRQEVLSLVSHDLRSPLTVVRGYLDILDRPLDEDRRKAAIEGARAAAIRMEDLLNDLLHATRAERVFAPRVMRPVNLGALVEDIASSLQMTAEQQVAVSLEPDVTVLGDPARIEQAVGNLIGNSIKYGPAEGTVRVGVHAREGRALITVEDDGPGIPEDQRELLFERGARGESPDGVPGLGLGLYIVRVVAEALGGSAFVDGTVEHTRFVIDLPVMPADSAEV